MPDPPGHPQAGRQPAGEAPGQPGQDDQPRGALRRGELPHLPPSEVTIMSTLQMISDPLYFSIGWLRRLHTLNVDENDLEVRFTKILIKPPISG